MRSLFLCAALLLGVGCTSAPERLAQEPDELTRLEAELEGEGESYETRWQLSAASLDVVDGNPEAASKTRLSYARRALAHADAAIKQDEGRVEAHYYRAIALGRVLELESLPDLDQIKQLESSALRAREIDPTFKHAGPLRFLAFLYMKAPPWPLGPENAGEEDEIENLWQEALQIASGWVENHVGFAEFLYDEGRDAEALAHVRQARSLLPKAELDPISRQDLSRRIQELMDALQS